MRRMFVKQCVHKQRISSHIKSNSAYIRVYEYACFWGKKKPIPFCKQTKQSSSKENKLKHLVFNQLIKQVWYKISLFLGVLQNFIYNIYFPFVRYWMMMKALKMTEEYIL